MKKVRFDKDGTTATIHLDGFGEEEIKPLIHILTMLGKDLQLELKVISDSNQKYSVARYSANHPELAMKRWIPDDGKTNVFSPVQKTDRACPVFLLTCDDSEAVIKSAYEAGYTDVVPIHDSNMIKERVKRELIRAFAGHNAKKMSLSKENENSTSALIECTDGLFWVHDKNGFRIEHISAAMDNLLGNPMDEALYSRNEFWARYLHPDDRQLLEGLYKTSGNKKKQFNITYRLVDKNGTPIWVRDNVKVIGNGDGEAVQMGWMKNISEKIEIEEERGKVNERLKERVKELNCLRRITALSEKERTVKQLLHEAVDIIPEGFQYPEDTVASILFEGKRYVSKGLAQTEWSISEERMDEDYGSLSATVFYTVEKKQEDIGPFLIEEKQLLKAVLESLWLKINRIYSKEKLDEKQKLLKRAQLLAGFGSWELDLIHSTLRWSGELKELGNIGTVPKPYTLFFNLFKEGRDRSVIKSLLKKARLEGRSFDKELKIEPPDRKEIWVRIVGEPEFVNGKCVKIFGSVQNIDKRKRAEIGLKLSENRFKSLIRDGSDLIAILNSRGEYVYAAPSSQRKEILGLDADELIGKNWLTFISDEHKDFLIHVLNSLTPGQRVELKPYRFKDVNGDWRWMESTVINLTNNASIGGYLFNSRDVTERIERERKLRDIVEHSTNLFFKHDADHNLLYVSPQSREFVGLEPDETMKKWTELLTDHPVNLIGFKKTVKALETGKAQKPYELQFKHANGSHVWARVHEAPIVENGQTVAMVGSLTDITEQKISEQKVRDLSLVAAKTTDMIVISDEEDRISWVNNAFTDKTGYELSECQGMDVGKLLRGAETSSETIGRIQKAISRKEPFQATILNYTKDGVAFWAEMTVNPIFEDDGNLKGFIAINRDVTEKIEREKRLKESIQRYETVSKATSDVIWELDLEKNAVHYNENIYKLFGYRISRVENAKAWWRDKIHPEDREYVESRLTESLNASHDRFQLEYRFKSAEGHYKYVLDRAFIIRDEYDKAIRIIGAMQDETRQKEERLWLKILESAIENTSESIVILEGEPSAGEGRKILYTNRAFEEMTGYNSRQVKGQTLHILVGPDTSSREIESLKSAMERSESYETEFLKYKKNGQKFWVHVSYTPLFQKEGFCSHWIVIGRDVTARKERVKALKDSLKEKETLLMEIHHRVKNNLAVVSSMMQLQAMQEMDETLQKKLYDSVSRIRTMVTIHEMLYQSHSFTKIDLCSNIKKLVNSVLNTIPNNTEIEPDFTCQTMELNVNQAIPVSLIVNEILTNAVKHAFKDRDFGRLMIRLEEQEKDMVSLQIIDDGVGLPDSTQSGQFVSLGFQLVQVLTEQLQGNYSYQKAREGGTEFRLLFQKSSVNGIGNVFMQ